MGEFVIRCKLSISLFRFALKFALLQKTQVMLLSHEMLKELAVNYLLAKEKYRSSACALHKRPRQPRETFTQHINRLAWIINHSHTANATALLSKILQSKQHGCRLTVNLSGVPDPEFIEPGLQ